MLAESLQQQCVQNTQEAHVICLQDTTEFNFHHHRQRLKENTLGVVGNNTDEGFMAHVMLCFDAQSTLPLGITYAKTWSRDPITENRHRISYPELPIEEKESYRWVEAAEQTKELLSNSKHLTFISDRESDIYQLWSWVPDNRTDLIIRARRDRNLHGSSSTVYNELSRQDAVGSYCIEIKDDARKDRIKRKVKLNVKFTKVEIPKPQRSISKVRVAPDSLSLYVVEAKEDISSIPKGEQPIHWILFTTYRIEDFTQAVQIIHWYCFRWQIEQFFRLTKKQGIDLESSQLETGEGLMKLSLIGFAAALKILQLTRSRDGAINDKVDKYFTPLEVDILTVLNKDIEGKTAKQKNPYPKMTLSWAAWIIARLGGYSGYKSQSPPGPITFKWGLDKFNQITVGYALARVVYKE
jgi:hypothetical protein